MTLPGIVAGGSHQTTKSHARVFHVGLDRRDLLTIEGMFRTDPLLLERFLFGPSTETDPLDVVFVNADDPSALASMKQLLIGRPELAAVLVSDTPLESTAVPAIVRPISFRDSGRILEAITTKDVVTARHSPGSHAPNELRVLVVDDSLPARQYIKVKLTELAGETLSVIVDLADSAETALLAADLNVYDLIFVDVIMPGMDGYELCRLLKQKGHARIAMLTGRSLPADYAKGKAAGCDHYLPKPPNDFDMRSVLRLTSLRKATSTG